MSEPNDNALKTELGIDGAEQYAVDLQSFYVQPSIKAAQEVSAKFKEAAQTFNNFKPNLGGANPVLGENLKTLKESLTVQKSLAQAETTNERLKRATLATERERLAVESARLALQTKQEKLAPVKAPIVEQPVLEPTISRFYENEADKIEASVKKIKEAENTLAKRSGYKSVGFTTDDAGNITDRNVLLNKPKRTDYKYDPSKPSPNEFGFKIDYNDSQTIAGAKRVKDSVEKIGEAAEKSAEKFGKLRGFGAIFRELNLGLNETEINAALAGAEIAGIGAGALATFGAAAVAGVAVVKVSQQIKSEAEARLRGEELIVGAINKQVIGLRDAFAEYEKFKASAINDKAFTNRLTADVGVFDTKAILAEHAKVEAKNKSSIVEANRLQAQLAQNQSALEFEKARPVRQNLFSEIGIGNEYTASQKGQNVANAERSIEETKKALAEQEQALEKGKSALQQADKALIDVRDKQDEYFTQRGEAFKKSQELTIKAEQSRLENNYSVQNALLERNVQLGINTQEQGYSESLKRRQNFISEEINVQARFFDSQLALYSNDFVKTIEITAQRNDTIRKLNTEFRIAEINAQKELFQKITEFRDFLVSAKSEATNNPFVKLFSDIDTAGERAQKRFGLLGKEAVKFAADAEKAVLNKKLGELRFDTNLQSLKFDQEARRVDQLPFTQTREFTQSLASIEKNVQHIADSTDLSRKSKEADFYATQYNPNNPKSFDEFSRGGFNEARRAVRDRLAPTFEDGRKVFTGLAGTTADLSEIGKQIANAKEEFKKLDALSAGASGLYGQELVANRKLALLPDNNELLKRLKSPDAGIREDAQFALNQKAQAYDVKKRAEEKRFQDSLDLDAFQDLRQKDFKEQFRLLQNSSGLDKEFAAKSAISIANELGINNLDQQGRLDYRNANRELAAINAAKEREAAKEKEEKTKRDTKFDDLVTKFTNFFGANGLKVDVGNSAVLNLTVQSGMSVQQGKKPPATPTANDTAEYMGLEVQFTDNKYQKRKSN